LRHHDSFVKQRDALLTNGIQFCSIPAKQFYFQVLKLRHEIPVKIKKLNNTCEEKKYSCDDYFCKQKNESFYWIINFKSHDKQL
jgi:hypothetical protein